MSTLVTYFSATGTTKAAAEKLARAIGADIAAIEPAEPYTAADLDWRDESSRCTREHRDRAARPAIKEPAPSVADYDVVFVGYPLWWEKAPNVVRTFLEGRDFAGKTVVTFATSSTSIKGSDGEHLHDSAPQADWKTGRRITSRDTEATLKAWAGELGL